MIDIFVQSDIWQFVLWGNTIANYTIALSVFFGFLILFKLFQVAIIARLKKFAVKTKTDIDDTLIEIVRSLKPPFYSFLAFFFALKFLSVSDTIDKVVGAILVIWVILQAIIAVGILIDYVGKRMFAGDSDEGSRSAVGAIKLIAKIALWSIGLLMILSNLGIDVTSLIAGLGIGGIAIALAAQNILSDLFSSFSIYFDKPFAVGDFIVIGDKKGTVEKIGIKTTRIKALQGEELIISNQELTSAQIQNFKKLEERRADFSFGITYETPIEKIEKVSSMIESIIGEVPHARFDRAHFMEFGDSALNFAVVYYVESKNYVDYANAQQKINIAVLKKFASEGIEMAYPTQTLYIQKS